MLASKPLPDDTTPVEHVHRRNDWRPCPATLLPPLRPRKAAARWWFEFAEAVLFEETFREFVKRYPAEFPTIGRAS